MEWNYNSSAVFAIDAMNAFTAEQYKASLKH
jgi:hypothetical protein